MAGLRCIAYYATTMKQTAIAENAPPDATPTQPIAATAGHRLTRRAVLVASLGALAMAGSLAACTQAASSGTGQSAAAPAASKASDLAGTVVWLTRTNVTEQKWEQDQVVPKFTAQYPKIKVDLLIVPPAEFDTKLTSLAATNQTPDLFSQWGNGGFGDYYVRGLLLELTSRISRDKLDQSKFLDGVFDLYKRNGKYYSMPQVTNYSNVLLYNRDLFERAGIKAPPTSWDDKSWTWDAMLDVARKLTKDPTAGAEAQFGCDLGGLRNVWNAAYLWGGDPFLPEHYTTGIAPKTQLDTAPVMAASQAQEDLIYKLHVAPTADEIKALAPPPQGGAFATGKIGMGMQLPTTAYRDLQTVGFKWGMAALPRQADNKRAVFNGTWLIAKDSKVPDAAWELTKYLVSAENAKDMTETTGFLVPLKSATNDWLKLVANTTGLKADDLRLLTEGSLKHAVENPNHLFVEYNDMNTVLNEVIAPVWAGKAAADNAIREGKPRLDSQVATTYNKFKVKAK